MDKRHKNIEQLIKILYVAQIDKETKQTIDEADYPHEEIEQFEKEIGKVELEYAFQHLWEKGISNIKDSVVRPFLTLDGIVSAEYIMKPIWQRFFIDLKQKKINWTALGLVLTGITLLLNVLINLDKLEVNYNKYFLNITLRATPLNTKSNKTAPINEIKEKQ